MPAASIVRFALKQHHVLAEEGSVSVLEARKLLRIVFSSGGGMCS
jgi:hypothetical protein